MSLVSLTWSVFFVHACVRECVRARVCVRALVFQTLTIMTLHDFLVNCSYEVIVVNFISIGHVGNNHFPPF